MSRDGGPLYIPLSSFVRSVALFGWLLLRTNRVAMVSRFLTIALVIHGASAPLAYAEDTARYESDSK